MTTRETTPTMLQTWEEPLTPLLREIILRKIKPALMSVMLKMRPYSELTEQHPMYLIAMPLLAEARLGWH
jgi:hypothetical protein